MESQPKPPSVLPTKTLKTFSYHIKYHYCPLDSFPMSTINTLYHKKVTSTLSLFTTVGARTQDLVLKSTRSNQLSYFGNQDFLLLMSKIKGVATNPHLPTAAFHAPDSWWPPHWTVRCRSTFFIFRIPLMVPLGGLEPPTNSLSYLLYQIKLQAHISHL